MRRFLILFVTLVLLALWLPECYAASDEGKAKFMPWSGYWWPLRQGGLVKPLKTYDRATGREAAKWEEKRLGVQRDVPQWFGYCHAWSAAAVIEHEPRTGRQVPYRSDSVAVNVGDQKGFLTGAHAMDIANVHGDRFGDGSGSEDKSDISPEFLWQLLTLYVKQQGVPLILDVESGPEVWNYPVYAYQITYQPESDGERQRGRFVLLLADDAVPPEFVGTLSRRHVYEFEFRLHDGAVVSGSSRWTGNSQDDHPDFAWYPYVSVPENPELDYPTVRKLVGMPMANSEMSPIQPANTNASNQLPANTPPQPATQPTNEPRSDTPLFGAAQQSVPSSGQAVILSPSELVELITNRTSSFVIDATVDKFDGGHYQIGDTLTVRVASEKAGYLHLLQIDSTGDLALLYPQPGDDNKIPTQQQITVPSADAHYIFQTAAPAGVDRIIAVVTTRPLALTGVMSSVPAPGKPRQAATPQPFRWHPTQQQQLRRALLAHVRQDQQSVEAKSPMSAELRTLLGNFSHDETVFVVDRPKAPDDSGKQVTERSP